MARHAERRKVRKGRIFGTILVLLLLLVVVFGVIGFFQYQSSLKTAEKASQMKSFEFNGAKTEGNDINVLFIGSDSRGADQGRSDSLMIAHYDKKNEKAETGFIDARYLRGYSRTWEK